MGYLGNQTSNAFTSITKQDLTGVTGSPAKRGFTLDHAVANANEIEVFVNNVRQEPAVAYTVSGTGLTMTGDVETTDDFYVVFQGKAVGTVVPPDDSVTTARINDGAVTTDKIAANAVTRAKLADDLSGTNLTIDTTSSTFTMTDLTSNAFYRTNTWTPVMSSIGATDEEATIATGTYQLQYGTYTRVGDLVYAYFGIQMPSSWSYTNGVSSGQPFTVSALPFKIKNNSSYYPSTSQLYWDNQTSGWDTGGYGYDIMGLGVPNKKYIRFYYKAGNDQFDITAGSTANSMVIRGSLTYCTDEA